MRLRACWVITALLLSACGGSKSGIEIRDAWSPSTPPGATVLAIYATITAHSDDTLVSVTTPIAREAQLHSTVEENGMMKMRPVTELHLKAGETLKLEPGGMHLMLVDPDTSRAADSPIPLAFHFEHAGNVYITASVKKPD
ncbi:MAG: copper chaperone PCu(A)C [Povalibacter sp.]